MLWQLSNVLIGGTMLQKIGHQRLNVAGGHLPQIELCPASLFTARRATDLFSLIDVPENEMNCNLSDIVGVLLRRHCQQHALSQYTLLIIRHENRLAPAFCIIIDTTVRIIMIFELI